jgi:nicotinamidase/pyrazinamidase
LDQRRIRNLVVGGLATDYCVRATALDGIAYGYNVTLVKGACRGVNNVTIAKALAEMADAGVNIVESAADVVLQ